MSRAKPRLSRREQEILDIVYARGHATAAEVREAMHDAPTDAAVRTTLRILVAKGHLRIEQDGPRYDYWPTVPADTARRSELRHVLRAMLYRVRDGVPVRRPECERFEDQHVERSLQQLALNRPVPTFRHRSTR